MMKNLKPGFIMQLNKHITVLKRLCRSHPTDGYNIVLEKKAYPILEKILKTVYEQDGWVPYTTIDDKLSSNLRKITGIVNKLELKPFLEYDHNYTSEDQKGKGRIRIADGSRNLIKSVLDDLGS